MFHLNKPFLKSLFIFALLLFPITQATAEDMPQEINRLQADLMEANEKIAMLTSDQQRIDITISSLQTSLNSANQEINNLKVKKEQIVGTNTETRRIANGHGR